MNNVEFVHGFLGTIAKLESKPIPPEVQKILDRPLPPEAIGSHPTKSYLSTIKSIFIIDQMNEAFGRGEWYAEYEIIDNSKADIIVKGYLVVPKYGIFITNFGGNDNGGQSNKNFDQGDAYKGACTDALTKMASYLGIGAHIYRGAKNAAPRQPRQDRQQISKKRLGETGFLKVVERFNNGEHDIIEKTMKIFDLTPVQKKKINELQKQLAAEASNGNNGK